MPKSDFFKAIRILAREVNWQRRNWGRGTVEPVHRRIDIVQKHLTEAKLRALTGDEAGSLDELRVIAGILFQLLTRPKARPRK